MRFEIQELNNQFNSIFRNSDDMTSHDDLGPPSGLDNPKTIVKKFDAYRMTSAAGSSATYSDGLQRHDSDVMY